MTIQVVCPQCSHRQSLSDASRSGPPTCSRCGALLRLASRTARGASTSSATSFPASAAGFPASAGTAPIRWPVRRAWWAAGLTLLAVAMVWRSGQFESNLEETPTRPAVAAGEVVPVRGRVWEFDASPTSGAVVILWPVVVGTAQKKIAAADLWQVAGDSNVAERLARQIRALGGDLAVTDPTGEYQLRVVSGEYYWMVVDCRVEPNVPKVGSRAMAELGRYLTDVPTLTRHHRTAWRQLHIREQLPLDYTWEATR